MRTFLGAMVVATGVNIGLTIAAPDLNVFDWRWWAAVVTIIFSGSIGRYIQGYRQVSP